jgi:hypothetical protein
VYLELSNAYDQLVNGKVCPSFMTMHGAMVDDKDRLWTFCQDAGSLNIKEYLRLHYPFRANDTPCSGRIRYVTHAAASLLEGAIFADREWDAYLPDIKSSNIMVDNFTGKPTIIDPTSCKKQDMGAIIFSTAEYSSPEVGLGIIARQLCRMGLTPEHLQTLVEDEDGSFPWAPAMGKYLDPSVNPLNEVTAAYSIAALVEELLLPDEWDNDAAVAEERLEDNSLLVWLSAIISKERAEEVAALMTSVLRDPEEVVAAAEKARLPKPLQDLLREGLVTEPENRGSLQRLFFLVMQAVAEVKGWKVEGAAGGEGDWSYVPPAEGEWCMIAASEVSDHVMGSIWSSSRGGSDGDCGNAKDARWRTNSSSSSSSHDGSDSCSPPVGSDGDSSTAFGLRGTQETNSSSSSSNDGSDSSLPPVGIDSGDSSTAFGLRGTQETNSSSSNNGSEYCSPPVGIDGDCSPACALSIQVGITTSSSSNGSSSSASSSSSSSSPPCDITGASCVPLPQQQQPLHQPLHTISSSSSGHLVGLQLLLLINDAAVTRQLRVDPVACAIAAAETVFCPLPCSLGMKAQGVLNADESKRKAAAAPSAASNGVVNGEKSLYKLVSQWMAKAAASVTQSWQWVNTVVMV